MKRWQKLSSKLILDTRWIKIRQDKVKLLNGIIMNDYYVIEEDNAVAVLALTKRQEIPLVRQYKHAVGREMLELPGGYVKKGVSHLITAKKELLEETGYQAKKFKLIGKIINNPTRTTCINYIFLAEEARNSCRQQLDEAEHIEVVLLSPKEALRKIKKGEIWASVSVSGILLACRELGILL